MPPMVTDLRYRKLHVTKFARQQAQLSGSVCRRLVIYVRVCLPDNLKAVAEQGFVWWMYCPCHVVAPAILQSFDCASVFAPRLLCCACSFLLQCCKAFLVQLARPRKHSISYAVFVRSFFAVLFIVSFRAGRSMIEWRLWWIKAWFSADSV